MRPGRTRRDELATEPALQVFRERVGGLVSVRRLLGETLEDDGLERRWHAWVAATWGDRILFRGQAQHFDGGRGLERRGPHQRFVERGAAGVDVGPGIEPRA